MSLLLSPSSFVAILVRHRFATRFVLLFFLLSVCLSLSLPSLFLSLLFCIRIRLVVYAPSADFKNGSIGLPNA